MSVFSFNLPQCHQQVRRAMTFLMVLLGYLFTISYTLAADSGWLKDAHHPYAQARLRTDIPNDNQVNAVLEIQLAPGWKTYWRSPGEGGIPLELDWADNTVSSQILWTVPEAFEISGIYTQAYRDRVVLPLTISATGTLPNTLTGTLMLSSCSNICMLTPYDFSLDLTAPRDAFFDIDYQSALENTPKQTDLVNQVSATYQENQLEIHIEGHQNWATPQLFIDTLPDGYFGRPDIKIAGNQLTAIVPISGDDPNAIVDLTRKTVSFVVSDQAKAQDIRAVINQDATSAAPSPEFSLWQVIGFAFLGGLILNLMPCVLPVLGIKLGHILHTDPHNKTLLRRQFFASSAGIIVSFWLLALLMTVLRLANASLSWGIQFQNPIFIGFMVIVTALFSVNLFGLLEFYLPNSWTNYLATRGNNGLRGHFLQGMLATLLATPCSAPFLGTALAVALIAPLPQLWLIFTFLGLGMSLPWLVIALVPKFAQFLPKPGRWMNVVKLILGLMMLASSLWLFSLLTNHISHLASGIILTLFTVTLLFAIAKKYGLKILVYTLLGGCLAVGGGYLLQQTILKTTSYTEHDNIDWQPLSEEAIENALASGKRVFVDVTADWCMTCKMNKINVLMREEIQQLLAEPDVIALRGDWTKPTDAITQFLKKRGQFAVPYNQIYGPGLPNGVALSPILTTHDVITLMHQAKG